MKPIAAVGAWVFQPAARAGQPVNVYATIEVTFHAISKNSNQPVWYLARANFQIPADAMRPVVGKIRAPQIARGAASATATVQFEVNEKGSAVNVKVEKASGEGWGHEVIEALREWKFAAARKDGALLAVPCTMDFVRAN
jgi:TonB family protein